MEVNQRHKRLIDGLLVVAASDQHLTEHRPVDLATIARQATALSADAAHAAAIEIRTTLASAPSSATRCCWNVSPRTCSTTPSRYNIAEHGWVSVTTGTAGGHAFLTVENTGPTVPDDIAGLFEPFHRLDSTDRLTDADPAKPGRGAGLGLSIVRSVAHAHDGDVQADPRPGRGLTIRVRIPPPAPTRTARQARGRRGARRGGRRGGGGRGRARAS